MSDNPLADWLRERGAWSGDGEEETAGPSTALGGAPPAPDTPPAGPAPPSGGPHPSPTAGGGGTEPLDPLPPGWPDEPEPPRERPRRTLLLLGLAGVPWLGFAAVALGGLGGADAPAGGDDPAQDEAAARAPAPSPVAEPDLPTDPPPGRPTTGSTPDSLPPGGSGDDPSRADAERRAGATAALAVRTDLTGDLPAEGGTVRYVDLAVAESVRWVEDVAVVEVAAVVLESTGDAWGEPEPARFAVPVRVTGSRAVPIAAPWPVGPPATPETPSWEPVGDTDLAASAVPALTEGGFHEVTEVALARSSDVPGVLAAEVTAVGPGSAESTAHRVWLRDADPPSLLTDPTTPEEGAP